MKYYSTKRVAQEVDLKEAVFKGLPEDNGLYLPEKINVLPDSFFEHIDQLSFSEIAFEVAKTLLDGDVPDEALKSLVDDAMNFEVPLVPLKGNIYALELFHGPTLAFKDFGARFMSRLMAYFLEDGEELNILVATSGDTGSAVAQGFLGVKGIKVTILYPKGKVSKIQEQQLTTNGQNVQAIEVEGTFDDCQKLVKEAFLDEELKKSLRLSSANSINISRLIPQTFYYFYAYAQLKKMGQENVVFCTPSGNYGNISGGIIAQKMGLPIAHFVAATNANDIVPQYLETAEFSPKPSVATISNAMDVGNPSNFQRLVELYGDSYETMKNSLSGFHYDDAQTRQIIREVYEQEGYLLCPHSAIGYQGIKDYLKASSSAAAGVFLATAHPCKFGDVVEPVIGEQVVIPDRLQEIIQRKKVAIPMGKDFDTFKKWLMDEQLSPHH